MNVFELFSNKISEDQWHSSEGDPWHAENDQWGEQGQWNEETIVPLTGVDESLSFNSQKECMDYFEKIGKTRAQGAAAWNSTYANKKPKDSLSKVKPFDPKKHGNQWWMKEDQMTPQAQQAAQALQKGIQVAQQKYPNLDHSFAATVIREIKPDGTIIVAGDNSTSNIKQLLAQGGGANFKVVNDAELQIAQQRPISQRVGETSSDVFANGDSTSPVGGKIDEISFFQQQPKQKSKLSPEEIRHAARRMERQMKLSPEEEEHYRSPAEYYDKHDGKKNMKSIKENNKIDPNDERPSGSLYTYRQIADKERFYKQHDERRFKSIRDWVADHPEDEKEMRSKYPQAFNQGVTEGSDSIQVHDFSKLSPRDLYDETQTNDNINDGDILISSNGIGIMVGAWPVVVVGDIEGFHKLSLDEKWETFENGRYLDSVKKAQSLGRKYRDMKESMAKGIYRGQFKSKEEAIAYAKERAKTFRDPEDGIEIWEMPSGWFDVVNTMNSNGRNHCIRNGGKKLGTIGPRYKGVVEGSGEEWHAEDPKDEMYGVGDAYRRGVLDYRKFKQTKVKPNNPYSHTKQARQADGWEKGFEDGQYKQDVEEGRYDDEYGPPEYDPNEADYDELRAQDRHDRRYSSELARHPNCNDPDHPGCENCEGDDDMDDDINENESGVYRAIMGRIVGAHKGLITQYGMDDVMDAARHVANWNTDVKDLTHQNLSSLVREVFHKLTGKVEEGAKHGLYYNINKRKEKGLPPKKPGQKGYPASDAFDKAAKTAKKEGVEEMNSHGHSKKQQAAIAIAKKGVAETAPTSDNRQWSKKDIERLRVATKGFDDLMDRDPSWRKSGQDMTKQRLKTKPIAGPKGVLPEQDMEETAAWQKSSGKNKNGGLNKKGVASYRREHPGSKLKTAVTKKPSEIKKGSKDASRRKSFCARMRGMKKHNTSSKTAHDPNSRINKSLRKWHCESIEELQQMLMIAEVTLRTAEQLDESMRDAFLNKVAPAAVNAILESKKK